MINSSCFGFVPVTHSICSIVWACKFHRRLFRVLLELQNLGLRVFTSTYRYYSFEDGQETFVSIGAYLEL